MRKLHPNAKLKIGDVIRYRPSGKLVIDGAAGEFVRVFCTPKDLYEGAFRPQENEVAKNITCKQHTHEAILALKKENVRGDDTFPAGWNSAINTIVHMLKQRHA